MVMALGKSVGKPRQSGFTTEGSPPFGDPERGDSLISTVISAGSHSLTQIADLSALFVIKGMQLAPSTNARCRLRSGRTNFATVRSAFRAFAGRGHLSRPHAEDQAFRGE